VQGSLEDRRFVAAFGRNGRLVGALGFSMPAQVMRFRKLIADRTPFADAVESAT
jgi:3-phenylpropionate/trans-cinnamate dioxygenase ferredoxin reductase subunit